VTNFPADVAEFLRKSGTPQRRMVGNEWIPLEAYLSEPSVEALSEHLYALLPTLSHRLIDAWLVAIMGLIDVPNDLSGILPAEDTLTMLVPAFLPSVREWRQSTPGRIFTALFRALKLHSARRRFGTCPRSAQKLFLLHVRVAAYSRSQATTRALYRQYGALLHRGIRAVEASGADGDTIKSYAWTIRAFLRYPPTLPARLPMFSRCRAVWEKEFRGRDRDGHAHRLGVLEKGEGILRHEHGSPGTRSALGDERRYREHDPLMDLGMRMLPPHSNVAKTGFVQETSEGDLGDEGTPWEGGSEARSWVGFWMAPPRQKTVSTPPFLERAKLNYALTAQFRFWPDSRCSLPLVQLGAIYEYVNDLLRRPTKYTQSGREPRPPLSAQRWRRILPTYRSVGLFALLALFTGREPADLIETLLHPYPAMDTTAPPPEPQRPSTLYFDWERQWFFFRQTSGRSTFRGGSEEAWRASTEWVPFPLPRPVGALMAAHIAWLAAAGGLGANRPLFQLSGRGGKPIPLDLRVVDLHLRSRRARQRGVPSVDALATAFTPLVGTSVLKDEVAARLISGRTTSAFAQLNYTWIALADLFTSYEGACRRFHHWMRGSVRATGWWEQFPPRRPAAPPEGLGIGSPLILVDAAIRLRIAALAGAVEKAGRQHTPAAVLQQHNAYTAYAYLLLLYLGVRPGNGPPWTVEDLRSIPDHLLVADKYMHEYRLLQLPALVAAILAGLAAGRQHLERALRQEFGSAAARDLPAALFCFFGRDGGVEEFSLRTFSCVLAECGAMLPRQAPLNIGRHWIRTGLRAAGFIDDAIDAWLGHQRLGRELLAPFSTTPYPSAMAGVRQWLDQALPSLGFRAVAYLPRFSGQVQP
jgi:hypothetical protein